MQPKPSLNHPSTLPSGERSQDWFQLGLRFLEHRSCLPLILVIAVGLRVGHILDIRSTIYFEHLDLDPEVFDLWGRQIAAGDWLGKQMFFVGPLYPYFLGIFYKTVGRNLLLLRLAQAGLGVTTCLLTARIGHRIFGRAVGNGAALLLCLYKPAIFYEAEVEKTVLAVFLFTLALLLFFRPTWFSRLLSGLFFGLSTIGRANLLILAPLFVLYLFVGRQTTDGKRRWLTAATPWLFGFLFVLSPVLVRNHHVGGEWAVTTSAGQNFYIGNNPLNETGGYCFLPFVRPTPLHEEEDFRTAAEVELGRTLKPGEVSRHFFQKAWAHVCDHPSFAAKMVLRKLILLLNDYELPDNQDMYFLASGSLVLRLPLLSFGWLLAPALLGLTRCLRNREAKLTASLLGLFFASIVAFFVQARFRMPLVPVVALFAASGLGWLVAQFRAWQLRRLVLAGVPMVGVSILSFSMPAGQDRTVSLALSLQNLAALHSRVGQYDRAVSEYERSLSLLPKNDAALRDLGVLYRTVGRLDKAAEVLDLCLATNPQHPDAWFQLGQVEQARGRLEHAARAYRQALVVSPQNHEAARALTGIGPPASSR